LVFIKSYEIKATTSVHKSISIFKLLHKLLHKLTVKAGYTIHFINPKENEFVVLAKINNNVKFSYREILTIS